MSAKAKESKAGFSLNGGDVIEWNIGDGVKDLILIDKVTMGMPTAEFYGAIRDAEQRGRGPVLLGMLALSVRAAHPDWSLRVIEDMIMNMDFETLTYYDSNGKPITDEQEEEAPVDPPEKKS